ncbi:MAG: hypothetical protein ACFE9Z_07030 [Promethearchaeota archaeon]
MFFQIEISREIQFLFYLVPVIIGFQLALYFFYQYYKIKDETLPLNRVLLAFGSFIIFLISGPLFIQISRNFVLVGLFHEIISRLGWLLAFFSTISVSFFIIRNEFSDIINLKIAKSLLVLNFIPIFMVFIVPTLNHPVFLFSISFVALNGLYVIRFQLILIKKSVGKIKRKFKLFLTGAVTSLFALVFAILVGLHLLPFMIEGIIYFIGVSELIIGFIIMIFSVYNFPPFYEFEWRDNLIKLLIINAKTMDLLYNFDFINKNLSIINKEKKNSRNFDKILSRSLLGFEKIIKIITKTHSERINKIKQENYQVFLQYGSNNNNLIFTLVVKKDLVSTNHLLNSIKVRFESFFKEVLLELDDLKRDKKQIFSSFDTYIYQILQE